MHTEYHSSIDDKEVRPRRPTNETFMWESHVHLSRT
jgi:hypothetical protein